MKKLIFVGLILFSGLFLALSFANDKKDSSPKVILFISEQNISGPQRCWWASEIDLSTIETKISQKLIEKGYEVLEPSSLNKVITKDPAFRLINLSESASIRLGKLSKADYVILGKAIASAGAQVPQSSMVSCFANVSARLIRVKNGKVVAYLNAKGNSSHMDPVTGGEEALSNAGEVLADKAIEALSKEGAK